MKRTDKPCECCGRMMKNVWSRTKYCPTCAKEKEQEWKRRRNEKRKARAHALPVIQSASKADAELRRIVRLADLAGRSYGYQVAAMEGRL